jgi:putative heme iron utilization protein
MNRADALRLARLLEAQRWAALATAGADGPLASMVACAPLEDVSAVLLHLSRLARHTGNLLTVGRGSLVLSEPDPGEGDPQTLARLTLSGPVAAVERDDAAYTALRARYLTRLPSAEPLFGFGDFSLFLLRVERAHYVGGFARAYAMSAEELAHELARARAEGGAG